MAEVVELSAWITKAEVAPSVQCRIGTVFFMSMTQDAPGASTESSAGAKTQ